MQSDQAKFPMNNEFFRSNGGMERFETCPNFKAISLALASYYLERDKHGMAYDVPFKTELDSILVDLYQLKVPEFDFSTYT